MKKTIIFDVDGTLLDSERVYMQAWKLAGAKFGYTVTDEALLQTRAVNSQVAEEVFRRCCGQDFPLDDVYEERVRISEELIRNTPADALLKPYARELLQWLRDKGCAMAVASTTGFEKTKAHLTHAGLWDFFSTVVCGDMVAHGKPEPDIFLKAAQLSGVKPADCIVVGDSPADVKAATAAGIPVILIPDQVPLNALTEKLSWQVLDSLSQVPGILEAADIV